MCAARWRLIVGPDTSEKTSVSCFGKPSQYRSKPYITTHSHGTKRTPACNSRSRQNSNVSLVLDGALATFVFKIKGMTKITQITNPKLTSIAVSKEQQRTAIEALTRSDVAFEADRI